ncbi:uncharacterized protein PAC_17821 [Phialocephala subalpina]|uniref:Protein kinase domain-containing protein n=1 Tax=Phialocephala subalpina TaxID=576137 RepID=A0A1L7XS80_9HELO|nr:uncharacterized protein PAC_17821 [Phialocephala subalpina]
MSSILNCFKRLKIPRRSQKQEPKPSAAHPNLVPVAQSTQISIPAPATPINKNKEPVADATESDEGTELVTVGDTAERVDVLLTEEPESTATAEERLNEYQSPPDRRPFVEERASTNGVPRIEVQRQATLLTTENGAAIHRSSSTGSLTPKLSRDNSQTSLRSRADSRGSSSTGHWLKEQLDNAGLECPKHHHCFLIPRSALKKLITPANVAQDLQSSNPDTSDTEAEEYASTICFCARRLYATLAYIKKSADIKELLEEGITDNDLPFLRQPNKRSRFALHRRNGEAIKTLEAWEDSRLKKFDRYQWWMNSPVFKLNKEPYELNDKTILPFVDFEMPEGIETKKQGGYSEVYPVRVHPAHHEFWHSSESEDEKPLKLVAVKQLFSDDEKEFQKERTILTAMSMKNHPHLIKLLATYKYDGKYHLMFPFANANLRKYWDDRPSPAFDRETVFWSLQQMTGIADGLLRIHNFAVTHPLSISGPGNVRVQKDAKLSVQKGEEWFGRHGDIKPENVLWFDQNHETDNPMGILQIADFGLGRFHGRDSRSHVNPDTVFSSPTYEPPECKLRLPVSRAYDMWSLGCLYLEFITWMLRGSAEIDGFANYRGREATATGIDDDNFFTIVTDAEGQKATVREQVVAWTNELHRHEKCSPLIHDLLDLTMKGLLVVESRSRLSARWLHQELKELLQKAEKDVDYLLKPTPRKPEPERANTTPASLGVPKTNSTTNTKRNSVTFATNIKENVHERLPKDLVFRTLGTPNQKMKTWPTHGQQAVVLEMPQFAR